MFWKAMTASFQEKNIVKSIHGHIWICAIKKTFRESWQPLGNDKKKGFRNQC